MQLDFNNKVILVTGGTRGIGKSIVEHYLEMGGEVIATGQNKGNVKNLQFAIGKNSKLNYFYLDFLEQESLENFIASVKLRYTKIDVLVNNAGINKVAPIGEADLDAFQNVMKVNVSGPMILLKEIGNMMKKNGFGRVVNISSIFGVVARDKRVSYCTSKTALVGLSRCSAVDLAPFNILVNTISPGFVLTEMTARMLSIDEKKALEARVPIGRFAKPEEIARAVLFLTSDLNTYITAQNIVIDGGFVSV
jgi:3-oxoacyl-[acyl-carrier protein] reductase